MAYVDKGDKTTMDSFINESLSKSLKYLANLDDTSVLGDLDGNIERCKEALQERWSKSEGKWVQKTRLLPQPEDYDSALEGPWDDPDQPNRWVAIPQAKGQARRSAGDGDVHMSDDDDMFVGNISDSDPFAEAPAAKPAAKRGAAAKGGRGGAAKKAAPAAKLTTRARPKKGGFIVDSEDEEDEEEEPAQNDAMSLDEFNDDDEEITAPPKRAPRAAKPVPAKATKATTSRASTSRGAAKPAASKGRQSTLNFSQSQRPTSSRRVNQTQKTLTISDDEIDDDDDDDDGFEPVAPTRSSRR